MASKLIRALALAAVLFTSGAAAEEAPIVAGFGTPIIDGVLSPGEWDAATPRPVFTGLLGSILYVLNDDANLYLALWVPDPTFTGTDQFRVRIDSAFDGVSVPGDDEIAVVAPSLFFDMCLFEGFWGVLDGSTHGDGAASAVEGGNFFEMAHPLASGDPRDMVIAVGDTIGLCLRYNNDNSTSESNIYPTDCLDAGTQQSLYVTAATVTSTVGAPAFAGRASGLRVFPNPVARGAALEFSYGVPPGGALIEIDVYAVSGRRVAQVARGFEAAGERSVRWVAPSGAGEALAPGVYFGRLRYDGRPAGTRSFVLR